MPFRHLLFNRRNGAPQRAPDQQAVSLEDARFFSIDDEFPTYNQWPEHNGQAPQHSPADYDIAKMQTSQLPNQPSPLYHQNFEYFSEMSMNGIPYQRSPYDFDSSSLHYSSDMMETDVSSISQGSIHSSISSTTYLDISLDEDTNSLPSLSRKQSVASRFGEEGRQENLCPLITGQVGKCTPALCGPDAACLQYVNDDVRPLEECVASTRETSQPTEQRMDFTGSSSLPQSHHHPQGMDSRASLEASSLDDMRQKDKLRGRRPISKINMADDKDQGPATKQIKKSRARQAHSLVERKYRENLNAKIQELHQTLQRTILGKANGLQNSNGFDEYQDDVEDNDRSSKVKKSDVLVEAMNYVHAAEREMTRKDQEIEQLKQRQTMLESYISNGNNNESGMM